MLLSPVSRDRGSSDLCRLSPPVAVCVSMPALIHCSLRVYFCLVEELLIDTILADFGVAKVSVGVELCPFLRNIYVEGKHKERERDDIEAFATLTPICNSISSFQLGFSTSESSQAGSWHATMSGKEVQKAKAIDWDYLQKMVVSDSGKRELAALHCAYDDVTATINEKFNIGLLFYKAISLTNKASEEADRADNFDP